MGSLPFQKTSLTPFLCTALFRVLHLCTKGSQKIKKKTARDCAAKKKRKKDTGQPSLRLEFLVSSLSLSPLSSNPSFGRRPTQSVLRRRKKKKKKKKAFVVVVVYVVLFDSSREEGRAREREFFFVSLCVCAGGFKFKLGNQNDIRGFAFFVGDYIDRAIRARGDTFCAPRDGCFFCVCALKRARRRRDGCVGVWWRWSSSASRTTRGIDDDEKHQWRVFARFVDVRGARVTGMAGTTTTTIGREDGENEN